MWSNTKRGQDIDLAQVNELMDDEYIDLLDEDEAKKLLKRLRMPALFYLTNEAIEAKRREREKAEAHSVDSISRTKPSSFTTV